MTREQSREATKRISTSHDPLTHPSEGFSGDSTKIERREAGFMESTTEPEKSLGGACGRLGDFFERDAPDFGDLLRD
jgi:hypothetical protein